MYTTTTPCNHYGFCQTAAVPHNKVPDIDIDAVDVVYVYYKSRVWGLYCAWKRLLPSIKPYYAIKCNPDSVILDALSKYGSCFDAASPAEIDAALKRVSPNKIIYANPCKTPKDISYASSKGVSLTVFDNILEHNKVRQYAPDMKMLFRIYASDTSAQCVLSNKYGAVSEEWEDILKAADRDFVKGISFHIGSGANDPDAFSHAIRAARTVFDTSKRLGYNFSVLDIGGGFTHKNIEKMSACINRELQDFVQAYPSVQVIAEPGRYFAETVADLYTKVIGHRTRGVEQHYWINDSLYGSFNCILYDHAKPTASVVAQTPAPPAPPAPLQESQTQLPCIIWGSTCDGFDKILETSLPRVQVGDWLCWNNMGAYTLAGASSFNGIPFDKATKVYI